MLGNRNGANPDDASAARGMALSGVCKYIQGTVAILLTNALLEDADVDFLLARLPRLQFLDVSGTRKITHASAAALACVNSPCSRVPYQGQAHPDQVVQPTRGPTDGDDGAARLLGIKAIGRRQPLRLLNLQRCFQLHSGSLDEVLAARDVRVLALSHLDLGRWPAPLAASGGVEDLRNETRKPRPLTGLQVLALHNCMRLHGVAFAALAAAMDGAGGPAFLLLGGSTLSLASFVNSVPLEPPLPPQVTELLEVSYKPALTSTAATVTAHLAAARHLVAAALAMPRLAALELTFFPPPLVQCVRRVLSDGRATGRPPVDVWDFAADSGDVRRASRQLQAALRLVWRQPDNQEPLFAAPATLSPSTSPPLLTSLPKPPDLEQSSPALGTRAAAVAAVGVGGVGSSIGFVGGCSLDALAATTVLRCAVNCSSVTRSTPLHLAAERGNLVGLADLLAAGAVVDARDTAGSTAAFLAAEAGHAAALEALLRAGADPRLGNAAGETPLYISALRGHLGCVQALLAHCGARGIQWQDPELYGDAWTPLHAAAVANRADVAACLLQAAGATRAVDLVVAPNKYGQSVLHIAARKGSSQLLRLLLAASGSAGVGSRDGSGDTPVDVAKKNRHVAALAEFRRLKGPGAMAAGPGTASVQQSATAMA